MTAASILLLAALSQTASANHEATFAMARTWEQFRAGVRTQRELWLKTEAGVSVVPGLVERVERAGAGLQMIVVAEDWCVDSAYSVPYVARLAALARIPLRIVDRVNGEALMRAHRTSDGRTATPTVVLLRNGVDVGAWVERPAVLQDLFRSIGVSAENAGRFARRGDWYEADRGVTVLAEIVALIEQTGAAK